MNMWELLELIRRHRLQEDVLWEKLLASVHETLNDLERERDALLVENAELKSLLRPGHRKDPQ